MKKSEAKEESWETPSLEWLHRIRGEMHNERKGKPARPLSAKEAEALAKKYGLKVVQHEPAGTR
jgi:hypothetical protein